MKKKRIEDVPTYLMHVTLTGLMTAIAVTAAMMLAKQVYDDQVADTDPAQSYTFASFEACAHNQPGIYERYLPSPECGKDKFTAKLWSVSPGTRLFYDTMQECVAVHDVCRSNTILPGYSPDVVGWEVSKDRATGAIPLYRARIAGKAYRPDMKLVALGYR